MENIQKILVPLAFTDYSPGVFACGAQMALKNDADLIVLSIINSRDVESVEMIVSMGYDVDADHYVEQLKKERKEKLNQMVAQTSFPEDRVCILFKVGKPVDEILRVITHEKPDLVVMGTRGRSSLKNSIMGTVAEKVFKRSPVHVLSFRDPDVKQQLEKKLHL